VLQKTKIPVDVCTCGAPNPGQDYNGTINMSTRGGSNSSAKALFTSL